MPFTVKTTMDIVLEETQAEGTPPMLLPWRRQLTDAGPTARIGGGTVQPGSQNVKIEFPGITTLTTLWIYPDAEMDIIYGTANAQPITVQAGGCTGFAHGRLPADQGLRFTYTGTEPSHFAMVWAGE